MKFLTENLDTGSKWEFKVDIDKRTLLEVLDSPDWIETIENEYLTEDWIKKSCKYNVFGFEDYEITEIINEIKLFFEDQGYETDEINFISNDKNKNEDDEDEETEYEDEYENDIFEELFSYE